MSDVDNVIYKYIWLENLDRFFHLLLYFIHKKNNFRIFFIKYFTYISSLLSLFNIKDWMLTLEYWSYRI
jgi:hypothetical protein